MKRIILFLFCISLLVIPSSFVATEEEKFIYKKPFWMAEDRYYYNETSKVMTDNNGMTFKTETNGVITVNDERYLAFALKGNHDGQTITRASMDLDWTWHINQTNNDYIFWAEAEENGFVWKQYYYFYEDPMKQMKVKHYLENGFDDLTDVEMYYMISVFGDDNIEHNKTVYYARDYMPLYKTGNFNNIYPRINFNAGFDFDFQDLIDNGFDLNEFYIGSGGVIGYPNINITAIGFTKNNGNFPLGASVEIDPTFSTNDIEDISIAPLNGSAFVVAWCDEVGNDIIWQAFHADGTAISNQVTPDGNTGSCNNFNMVSASAFNSTSFVVGWHDITSSDATFRVYNIQETALSLETDADGAEDSGVSVSAFNDTTFVMCWGDGNLIECSIYLYSGGSPVVGPTTIDSVSNLRDSISVSTFNSSYFVVAFNDATDNNFHIVDNNLAVKASGTAFADVSVVASDIRQVKTLNSTSFVYVYKDISSVLGFTTFDVSGSQLVSNTNIDTAVTTDNNNPDSQSAAPLNNTAFVVEWADTNGETIAEYAIYDFNGNLLSGPITVQTSIAEASGIATASQDIATGIGFCNGNFVVANARSNLATWTAYQGDGTSWDGSCPVPPSPPADTCTCPASGNWNIAASDFCVITADCDMQGNNVYLTGTGHLTATTGEISNYGLFVIQSPALYLDYG